MASKAIAIVTTEGLNDGYVALNGGKYAVDSFIRQGDKSTIQFGKVGESYVMSSYDTENDPSIEYTSGSQKRTLEENTYTKSDTFTVKDVSDTGTIALMRTNPKLTGNIKLVVDSNEDMYLDTFKVNNALSNTKYHKVPVSYKSFYGRDVFSVFHEVASEDLYHIPADYRRIFKTAKDYSEQYIDTYRCGVKTNTDDLYAESFSAFAPIVIDGQVPDFFIIFKLDNAAPLDINKNELPSYLIKNGKQVKCFDLRENSKIGTYIRTFRDYGKEIVSPIYLSRHINTQSVYYGISLDRGSVANAQETINLPSYILDNQYNPSDASTDVFTYSNISYQAMNYDLVCGFERNRLISHNTLNLEFMFDDPDAGQFEQNTYFGLYVCTNELNKNVYYMTDDTGAAVMYDENNNRVTDIKAVSDEIKQCGIYGFETNDTFIRSISSNEDNAIANNVLSDRLGENVLAAQISKIPSTGDYNKFISIQFNGIDSVRPGEHYRILDETNMVVYEIVIGNAGLYKDGISNESVYVSRRYYSSGEFDYETHAICVDYEIVKRSSDEETLAALVNYIYKAFNSFDTDKFEATRHYGNTIVIQSKKQYDGDGNETPLQLYFERISGLTSIYSNGIEEGESAFTDYVENDANLITVFGSTTLNPVIIDFKDEDSAVNKLKEVSSGVWGETVYNLLIPFGYELTGSRIVYAAKFYSYSGNLYEAEIAINATLFTGNFCYEYTDADGNVHFMNYDKFNIDVLNGNNSDLTFDTNRYNTIISIYDTSKYMFVLPEGYTMDKIFLNEHYTFSRSICSIVQLYDYDYDINVGDDAMDPHDIDTMLIAGDKELENIYTFGSKTSSSATSMVYRSVFNLLYGRLRICDYALNKGIRTDVNPYTTDRRFIDVDYSNASIVSPSVCKWVTTGTDKYGNQMNIVEIKNMLYHNPTDNYDDGYSYNISDTWDGEQTECDLSQYEGAQTIHQMIINGDIDMSDIVKSNPCGLLFKMHEKAFGIISNGYCAKISFDNIKNTNVLNSINATYLTAINSAPVTGVQSVAELFVDEVTKTSYLITYGGTETTYQRDNLNGFAELKPIQSSNLSISGSVVSIPVEQTTTLSTGDKVRIILHCDEATIKLLAVYDEDTKTFSSDIKEETEKCSVTYYSRQVNDVTVDNLIYEISNIVQSDYNMDVFAKKSDGDITVDTANIGDLGETVTYLPVYIKKGTDKKFYQYKDDYTISKENIYCENETGGETPKTIDWLITKTQSEYVLDTFIKPKKVPVFDVIRQEEDGISYQVWDSVKWNGSIPYYLYTENDKRPAKNDCYVAPGGAPSEPFYSYNIYSAVQLDKEASIEIMANAFDKNLYKSVDEISSVVVVKRLPQTVYADEWRLIKQPQTHNVPGYSTGYMLKTYMNSIAIQKKKSGISKFEVHTWDAPFTRTTRDGKTYIYYNLSIGIEREVTNSSSFNKIWHALGINNTTYKKLFIKNTIMPLLKIDDSSEITIKFTQGNADVYDRVYNENTDVSEIYHGAEIVFEKGQYLLKIAKNETKTGTYQVKCNINI